jgi:hypothetical protein
VNEGVLVVDQQDLALAHLRGFAFRRTGIAEPRVADRRQHRLGLQFGLGFLVLGIGIKQQRRAGAHFGNAVLDADGAQRQAGVHVAVETDHADCAAIPGARALLVVFDETASPRVSAHR